MNKYVRWGLTGVGGLLLLVIVSWGYTQVQLARYSAERVYASPEEGMLALIDTYYPPEREVKMVYAGPNSPDGNRPYIWYVIAEVYASVRADGSAMGNNGCDAPGSYFLQTKEGWVHVPEQAFPELIGFWMDVFDLAGVGASTPSTDWAPGKQGMFCQ
jgi:hypothetical protein